MHSNRKPSQGQILVAHCFQAFWHWSHSWFVAYFAVDLSNRAWWLQCQAFAKSFQVVSFALWIVCRRKIGRLSAWWVSGCFISWGKFASWKGPLMKSREAMLSRLSVILIIFGIGCRNTCLRKERTSMRNHLKICWSPACQRNCSPTSPPVRLLPSLRRLNRRPPQKVKQGKGKSNDSRAKGQNSLHLL